MQIILGNNRWQLILGSKEYLDKTGKLFLFDTNSNLTSNVVTASQAEVGFVIFPLISQITNLSISFYKNFLFLFLIAITLSICYYSSIKISNNLKSKLFSIFFFSFVIFLSYPLYLNKYAEYSIYYFFALLAIFPIYYLSQNEIKLNFFLVSIIFFSIISTIFSLFREYCYLNLSIMFIYLIFFKLKSKKIFKLLCISILFFPIFTNKIVIHKVSEEMNRNYYNLNMTDKKDIFSKNNRGDVLLGHSVWQTMYASLSFLSNKHVKNEDGFHDDNIRKFLNRDKSIDIHFYYSDDILIKNEFLRIFLSDPIFLFKTFFAKIGIVIGYFFIIVNFGLLVFFKAQFINQNKELLIFLIINLIINSLFPILAIPSKVYLGGVFASSFLFLYFSILNYLNNYKLK